MQQWIGQTSSEAHISQQNFHPLHVAFSNLDRVHLFLLFTFFFSSGTYSLFRPKISEIERELFKLLTGLPPAPEFP